MTRAELREAVRQCWHDSPKSWVMAGLAFARLAPHILEELDRPAADDTTVDLFDLSSNKLDEGTPAPHGRRFGVV